MGRAFKTRRQVVANIPLCYYATESERPGVPKNGVERVDKVMSTSNSIATVKRVQDIFFRSIELKKEVAEGHCNVIVEMADLAVTKLMQGGKIMICGNGGSAADAQHLAAELLVRLRPHVNRGAIPAIALAMDTSSLTACGNDYSYDIYYQRMVEGLGREGDVLIGVTTSGKSKNINMALEVAREMGISTMGFLGGDGGESLKHCDKALIVPSTETGRVQEVHITAGHALMELIEDQMLERGLRS